MQKSPGTYRDIMTAAAESSTEGAEVPAYTTLLDGVPCKATSLRGAETFRGRQLEASADWVVECWWNTTLAGLEPQDRLTLTAGIWAGRTLNVAWIEPHDVFRGMPQILDIFCRENV